MRAATVFALSAGVALPAVVAAPAAYAATVTGTATLDDGRLTVTGLPGNALWVKVSVLASADAGAAVLASTDELSATSYNGWTTDAPVTLPEGTAFGDYPLAVEYRLPGGLVTRWTGGSFGYKLHTGVSAVAFDRKTTSYDRRDVTLSGKATTWNPATGERTPAAEGTPVKVTLNLTDAYGLPKTRTATATTVADGSFALPVTPDAAITGGTAEVQATEGTDPDVARLVPAVGVEKLTYRITSDANKYRVNAGTDVTVHGRVERLTEDGWKGFGGAPVVTTGSQPLSYDKVLKDEIGSGTSLQDGSFSYLSRVQYATTGAYTGLRPSVYYGEGNDRPTDVAKLAVPQQFSFTGTSQSIDQFGKVTVRGTLGTNGSCSPKPDWVALHVSRDGGRTWGQMASKAVSDWCGYEFQVWGFENALYRIYHPETDRFVSKTSTPVRLSRNPTRIVNVTISPSRPRKGGSMTVKGLVQQKVNGVWKAMPGARLTLVFKPKGDPNWYWAKKDIPTNSYGNFGFGTTNYGDGTWALVWQEKNGYFYSESRTIYVDAL
ncbi:hypothetical protein RGF97_14420 [Streptomyces roseicoloratus]|uniref:Uncharacterized protein n=1 Tax=Streptomyces roseicoloratus TaxID=2508722 RepID=A0ABY9RUE9_9ACTN|nr:hypothetical protein [Streptomyces roseicoloratus]WMX45813.1 hypothetical protein RGF97_14420 [Streptomyces roseicoloratus]